MYSADRGVHRRPWLHLRSHNFIIREVVNHIFYQTSFCWCLREYPCHFMDTQSTMACIYIYIYIYTYNIFHILYTKGKYSSHNHQRNWIYFTFKRYLNESWLAAKIFVNLLGSQSIDIGKFIIVMHHRSILMLKSSQFCYYTKLSVFALFFEYQ